MRRLHRQRHTNAKCRERDHWRSAHTDSYHLPEDRSDFEKLSGERRNKNPIEQTEIKLEIIFHGNSE